MSRPKLINEDTPVALRLVYWPFQFSASLGLAVVLIVSLAVTLAIGTFVEAAYGTPAAQFFVYQTWWFNAIMALLAVNIFCAAAIRFPWKKHQTGFVITHIGLLTLIFGATMSRLRGIDAQLPVFEHHTEKYAFDQTMHFDLTVTPDHSHAPGEAHSDDEEIPVDVHAVPFDPGPFNWEDYKTNFSLFPPVDDSGEEPPAVSLADAPLSLSRYAFGWMTAVRFRPQKGDVVYDQDGVKLELLNYFSDSREVLAPKVDIKISAPARSEFDEDGRPVPGKVSWQPVSLGVNPIEDQPQYPFGIGDSKRVGGGNVTLMLSGGKGQTNAFLNSQPEGPLGERGQVILHVKGKRFVLSVDDKFEAGRFPLGESGYEAEIAEYLPTARPQREPGTKRIIFGKDDQERPIPANPVVHIKLYQKEKPAGELWLAAVSPELNVHDYEQEVFGDYWFDYSRWNVLKDLAPLGIGSRIDILQDENEKLHYRYYNRKDVTIAPLPTDGTPETAVNAFKMPIAQLRMYVEDFVPAEKAEFKTIPLPFSREMNPMQRSAAQVRLTVDGNSEEFWIEAYRGDPDTPPSGRSTRKTIRGNNRTVALTLPVDAINIGFRVRLLEFERKLDPGTSTAAHFSSTVDLIDLTTDRTLYTSSLPRGTAHVLQQPADIEEIESAADVAIDHRTGKLFWTDHTADPATGKIYAISSDRSESTLIDEGATAPGAIAVSSKESWVYWAETVRAGGATRGIIRRAAVNGKTVSGGSDQVSAWLNHERKHKAIVQVDGIVGDLAIDDAKGKLYWINESTGEIGRCELDGSDVEPEFFKGADQPSSIAIDSDRGDIYWAEPNDWKILRAPLYSTGESETFLLLSDERLDVKQTPYGIAIDPESKSLVWSEVTSGLSPPDDSGRPPQPKHNIMISPLDGSTEPAVVCEAGVAAPTQVAVTDGQVVWVQDASMQQSVWITMNAPEEATDPNSGRTYRIFQEAFNGPFRPGERTYDALMPADSPDEELYSSILTINYDPGRGIRNIGCLLIVAGIATMFYMRAYFVTGKKRERSTAEPAKKKKPLPFDGVKIPPVHDESTVSS